MTVSTDQLVSSQLLQLENTFSQVEFRLPDGRSERMRLTCSGPTDFVVHHPVIDASGNTTIELEILKFEVVTTSEILWPGEKITMSGGRHIADEALPIYGRVTIPFGKKLEHGVQSEQLVYLQVDTPLGKLHNVNPVRMVGTLTQIPPVGSVFQSSDVTELYDGSMNPVCFAAICITGD